ncbi:MAG: hypothetical protein ACLTW9_00325 [Enterocloster sp.]
MQDVWALRDAISLPCRDLFQMEMNLALLREFKCRLSGDKGWRRGRRHLRRSWRRPQGAGQRTVVIDRPGSAGRHIPGGCKKDS